MNEVIQSDQEQEVPEQILADTAQIQFDELVNFAFMLGFDFNDKSFVRESKNALLKTITTLSFDTMTKIYNSTEAMWEIKWSTCGKYSFFALNSGILEGQFNLVPFYTKDVVTAFEGKGLKKVKLQLTRNNDIVVLSHKIEFNDREEAAEFTKVVASLIEEVKGND